MPDENFCNPYRWVKVQAPPQYARPNYHHHLEGNWGVLHCHLTALTPLFIGGSKTQDQFLRKTVNGRPTPFIPGTTLKGLIRSLAEVVSGAAVAHGNDVDTPHQPGQASQGTGVDRKLDTVARMFGTLQGDQNAVYGGAIQFSEAPLIAPTPGAAQWTQYKVVVGNPKPSHTAFYPSNKGRKFYLHKYAATELQTTTLTQHRPVRPAPVGSVFEFDIEYRGLADHELALLLYCLVLEEDTKVTLSPAATGEDQPVQLTGPMRHKLGGCKPAGGGSSRIAVTDWQRRPAPEARYRRGQRTESILDGTTLKDELMKRTSAIRERTDDTMCDLRAVMIYAEDDPRSAHLRYPSREWFNDNNNVPIPPTR